MGKGMVQIDVSALETLEKQLKQFPDSGGEALYKGINSALGSIKTIAFKEVPKVYSINTRDLQEQCKGRRAALKVTKHTADGAVEFTGRTLTMGRFFFYPFTPGVRLPVVAMIKRAGGMKRIKRQAGADGKLKAPFIAPTGAKDASKIQAIPFVRTGKYKESGAGQRVRHYDKYGWQKSKVETIRPLYTLSVPQMMENEKVRPEIEQKAGIMIMKRVEKEISKGLDKLGVDL